MKSGFFTLTLCAMVLLVSTGCDVTQLVQDLAPVVEGIVGDVTDMVQDLDLGPLGGQWHGGA